jgi:serine protease Do
VHVVRITDDSPAEAAGLRVGDRILAIDGTAVATVEALWRALWSGGPAEREVTLEIDRYGTRQAVAVRSIDRMQALTRARGI